MSNFSTAKENEALEKFRTRVAELELKDHQNSDHYLLRWLRARDLNIENAFVMLKKNLDWRKEIGMDTILTQHKSPQDLIDALPYQVSGKDNEGCYIFISPTGQWDIRNLCERGYKNELTRSTGQFLEMIEEFNRLATKETGKPITQMCMINDMEGYSMRQLLSSDVRESNIEMMKLLEANFPEILRRSIVVNAPKVFSILFNLIKPLLSARTLSKVSIFDSNRDSWTQSLLDDVHPDELPAHYGGTNTSVPLHTLACGFSLGLRAPEYSSDLFKTVSVPAASDFTLPFEIDTPGTTISWNFRTETYDIGFKFLYDKTVIYSASRADSQKYTMKGIHVCEKPGTYTLCFDNKFSKMRAKSLSYHVSIKKANNNED